MRKVTIRCKNMVFQTRSFIAKQTAGWHILFEALTAARSIRRWLLPAVTLALVLGIKIPFQSAMIQAQDTGQRLSAHFVLGVDTSDPRLNNLCIGESLEIPVRVSMQSIESVGGDVGSWTVNSADLYPVVQNRSIVSAEQSGFVSNNSPNQVRVELTGQEMGRTTITITATIQTSIIQWLDEDVALPIPVTSQAGPISVPVRVVPCEYRVTLGSIWETSMHQAPSTLLIANVHNARLRRTVELDTFEFEPPIQGVPFLEWTWANNRIIGCWASGGHFVTTAPRIRAHHREDKIEVTIEYARAVPGDANSHYYQNLCLPHHDGRPCGERPDGRCWVMRADRPYDWFEPQPLEGSQLLFNLDGGTISTTHRIEHSWGAAVGTVHITLTPVRLGR